WAPDDDRVDGDVRLDSLPDGLSGCHLTAFLEPVREEDHRHGRYDSGLVALSRLARNGPADVDGGNDPVSEGGASAGREAGERGVDESAVAGRRRGDAGLGREVD